MIVRKVNLKLPHIGIVFIRQKIINPINIITCKLRIRFQRIAEPTFTGEVNVYSIKRITRLTLFVLLVRYGAAKATIIIDIKLIPLFILITVFMLESFHLLKIELL